MSPATPKEPFGTGSAAVPTGDSGEVTTRIPSEQSSAVPDRAAPATAPGNAGSVETWTVRVRVTGPSPDGQDPVSVVTGRDGVVSARLDGDELVASVQSPADQATVAAALSDAGFAVSS